MATRQPSGRGPGRPPKGNRQPLLGKVPTEQKVIYQSAAQQAGLDLVDYVAVVMAYAHRLPMPDYLAADQLPDQLTVDGIRQLALELPPEITRRRRSA